LLLNGDGDVNTAHQLLVAAIESYPARNDPEDESLREALQTLFMVCTVGGQYELWAAFETAIARIGPRVPDDIALAWQVSADPARATGPALAQLESAIAELRDTTDPVRITRIGRVANLVDRVPGCRDALWWVVRNGREGGAVASSMAALALLSFDRVHTGDWDGADQLAEEGLAFCRTHGYAPQSAPFWLAKGMVAARRGDRDSVETLTEQMVEWALPRGARSILWRACHIRGLVALGHADFEEAYRQATTFGPPGSLPRFVPLATWSAMDLVEAAVHTGRTAEARRHVAALHELGVAAVSSRLALLVGGATAIAAPTREATQLFDEVLALPDDSWPFERARIELAYGEHLRRTRAVTAARAQLTTALDCFTRLGASSWADRANKQLRATGSGARQPDEPEPLLTPREWEIALLAATGKTNKQIGQQLSLSHRTVGAHLYRLFPKLGIGTRAALRDALHREHGYVELKT
jgi:DNA-binding CsgD family transcriptional regulator